MRRAAVNYGGDFITALIVFSIFITITLLFSSCVQNARTAKADSVAVQVDDARGLMAFLRTPVVYQGQHTTFSGLFTQYYYATDKERSAIKDALQGDIQGFMDRSDNQNGCWNVYITTPGATSLLSLWAHCAKLPTPQTFDAMKPCAGDASSPYQSAFIPLLPHSPDPNLQVCYRTGIPAPQLPLFTRFILTVGGGLPGTVVAGKS